ncbi:SusC/RagA family TonB-linked outer membrane protein, partial [uncultured Parabacteroides sp.]
MRITVILLFVALFQAVAVESSYSQSATVSVKAEQMSLTDLFSQIEKQSEFLFFYVDEEVKNVKVSVQATNKQINEVLSQALANTDLTYTIHDRNINITRKAYAAQQKQTKRITGKVTDADGEPIIGANVVEKGTTNGIITDAEGNFDLNVTPASILQISYIGYMTQEVPVENKNMFSIKLAEDLQGLDEVVVVGYGTQKKANLTGSVTSVSMKDMTKRQVGQTSMALQGLIPGVAITQRSGQ